MGTITMEHFLFFHEHTVQMTAVYLNIPVTVTLHVLIHKTHQSTSHSCNLFRTRLLVVSMHTKIDI